MKKCCFTILLSLSFALLSVGQQARVRLYKAPLAGSAVLADVDDKYNAQVYNLEMPEPDATFEQAKLKEIKQKIRRMPQKLPINSERVTSSVLQPLLIKCFVADSQAGCPPDNYSAISIGNKAVSVINSTISVHDAIADTFISRKDLRLFSHVVGLNNYFYDFRFDPKVLYDPVADRFICVMLNSTNLYNFIILAFSQTNNPVGNWNFYKFYGNFALDTTWFDYPSISLTKNELFLTGNKISFNQTWQAGFKQTLIYQFRKQDGYNGDSTLTYQIWDSINYDHKNLRCLYPLNSGDSLSGPSLYFLSNRNFDTTNDTIFLVKVFDTIGASDSMLTVTPLISPISYGVPPDARQPDTSLSLATNDGRVLGGYIRGNEIQFVSESHNPSNGTSSIYHGTISNLATTPSLTAQLFSIDSLDFGYPNISYTGNTGGGNQSIISFEYSGPRTYPGFGAVFYNGINYSDLKVIRAGDSTICVLTGKEQRWGDYSGSQPAWDSTGIVWVSGIYGTKKRAYGNYLAKLACPSFNGVPQISQPLVAPTRLFPNPGFQMVEFEFTVAIEQVIEFIIYNIDGRIIDRLPDFGCKEGLNKIQFNAAPLAGGTYILKITDKVGQVIATNKFIRE